MLRFTTKGAPFQRGVQQGNACRELALPWFTSHLGQAGQRTGQEAKRWRERIERVYPEGIEECRGIASGLGLDEESYFAVLCRFLNAPPQCTSCGLRDEHGQLIIAKTDDLFANEVGKNVLETTMPDRGYRHVHLHFAASIWTVAGMNEHGLAIAMTGIPGPTLDQDGMPSMFALHTILPKCANVTEAVQHIEALPINHYGFSLQVGDAQGDFALVEKTGVGMKVFPSQSGAPLLHTNHILDPEFAGRNPQQTEPVLSNGLRRYDTAMHLLRQLPHNEKGLISLLKDRSSTGAICQQGENGMHTDFAVLLFPVRRQFTLWAGPPATTSPETIHLASIFA